MGNANTATPPSSPPLTATSTLLEYRSYPSKTRAALQQLLSSSSHRHVVALYAHGGLAAGRKGQLCASVDVDSLTCQAYMKLAKVPHVVIRDGQPVQSPDGRLPFAVLMTRYPRESIKLASSPKFIIEALKDLAFDLDEHLSDEDRFRVQSTVTAVDDHLRPGLWFNLFCEPANSDFVTPHFADASLPWPARVALAREYRQRAIDYVQTSGQLITVPGELVDASEVYSRFTQGIHLLEQMLAQNVGHSKAHFIGDRYTSLDAYVFAYVDVLMAFAEVLGTDSDQTLKTIVFEHDLLLQWYQKTKQVLITL